MDLDLKKKKNGTALTVSLSGALNTLTAPKLSSLLDAELPGILDLTLDFTGCGYVSSAGLRVMLSAFKKMEAAKGAMRLTNVDEDVMDVLETTGLDAVFDLE